MQNREIIIQRSDGENHDENEKRIKEDTRLA